MQINSNKVIVNADQEKIFNFLKDANNIQQLLPQDKISDFTSTTDQCSFKVQSGIIISLIQDGNEEMNILYLKSGEKTPFPFRLSIYITPVDDENCEGYIKFDGELNMFLKMMVEKPLLNLFNYMSGRLQEVFKK